MGQDLSDAEDRRARASLASLRSKAQREKPALGGGRKGWCEYSVKIGRNRGIIRAETRLLQLHGELLRRCGVLRGRVLRSLEGRPA